MKYKNIVKGIFLERPNRFIAHVLINEKEEIVHVRNTGRCKELLIPGADVILEDCLGNINRKTRYSLIGVWKNNMLVNMDSQIPNQVVYNALYENKIVEIMNPTMLKKEVFYGSSRFDLYFEGENKKGFIEVKGVTLEEHGVAMFPDAPTKRGTKHVYEMIEAVKNGYEGYIFFLIQMNGPTLFKPNWKMDQEFAEAVKLAHKNGVKILCYDSNIYENGISIGKSVDIDLEK